MSDLVRRCRVMAGMLAMSEQIAWGSDSDLLSEAAAMIEALEATLSDAVAFMEGDISGPEQRAGIIREARQLLTPSEPRSDQPPAAS